MNPVRRVLPALILALFAGFAPRANALQLSKVITFGDSLSDSGYYRPYLESLGIPTEVISSIDRFSPEPGPVWPELVAQRYGLPLAPSNAGGTNFAQGGARVATNSTGTPPGFTERPVSIQVTEYLNNSGGTADRNALYTMWAGTNDLFGNFGLLNTGRISQSQYQSNLLGSVAAEIQQVGRLYSAGARYVMVLALPDLGTVPGVLAAGPAVAAAVSDSSASYNAALFSGLASAGLRVIPVDVFTLLNEVRADPAAYGFSNLTGTACGPFPPYTTVGSSLFCGPTQLVAENADRTYFYYDSVHPSSGTNRVIADFAASLIEGPVAYSMLGESALRTRAAHVQSVSEGLAIAESTPGKFAAFASAGGGNFKFLAEGPDSQLDSNNDSLSAGITLKASGTLTVGAALGRIKTNGTFGGDLGGFRSRENLASIFFGTRSGGFYFSGIASIANLDFYQLRRTIRIATETRIAESAPSGTSSSVSVSAGYDFAFGKFLVGPTVGWNSVSADVDAIVEAGAGSANLRIGEQKRRSEVVSLGVRASWDLGSVKPYARFTLDRERKNGERLITATPLSLASGNSYEIPAAQPADSNWSTATVGLRGLMTDWLSYGLNYSKVSGRGGVTEDYVTGTITGKF